MSKLARATVVVGLLFGVLGASPVVSYADVVTPAPKPAIFRNGLWLLRNSLTSGAADSAFVFGRSGDFPVMGDWDGDGTKTVGVVRGSTWYLRNTNSAGKPDITFTFGGPQDFPLAGDWNGDGRDTPGVVRCPTSPCQTPIWYIRNSASAGHSSSTVSYGVDGFPVVADWDGDGDDTPAVVDDEMVWGYANAFKTGAKSALFVFGRPDDQPVAGAWGAGGRVAPGVVRNGQWLLRTTLNGGAATSSFRFGRAGDYFLVWQ
ncbi:MAG: hypothetical protein ABI912_05700 [Actinomycetota bacterium]